MPCWHESTHAARTDAVVALTVDACFITSQRTLPEGTDVFLELSLGTASNAAKAEIDAVVVPYDADPLDGLTGFGVRFVTLDDAVRTWIERHTARSPTPTLDLAAEAKVAPTREDLPQEIAHGPSTPDGEPTRKHQATADEAVHDAHTGAPLGREDADTVPTSVDTMALDHIDTANLTDALASLDSALGALDAAPDAPALAPARLAPLSAQSAGEADAPASRGSATPVDPPPAKACSRGDQRA